jgi:hypothetical protein
VLASDLEWEHIFSGSVNENYLKPHLGRSQFENAGPATSVCIRRKYKPHRKSGNVN